MSSTIPDFRLPTSSTFQQAIASILGPIFTFNFRHLNLTRQPPHWSTAPTMPFRFLSLPPELRHLIYAHLFTLTPAILTVYNGHQKRLSSSSAAGGCILQTCRLIYAEALPILYSRTTVRYTGGFYVRSPDDLPLREKHLVESVAISNFVHGDVQLSHHALRGFHRLRLLHVEMFHATITSAQVEDSGEVVKMGGSRDEWLLGQLRGSGLWHGDQLKGCVRGYKMWRYIHDGRRMERVQLGVSVSLRHAGGVLQVVSWFSVLFFRAGSAGGCWLWEVLLTVV
jgi:hypothetical protein